MGFQHMKEIIHKASSSKGGKIRGKKGLAAMPLEKQREIQSKGGRAVHANKNNPKAEQAQKGGGGYTPLLETILRDLDENSDTWPDA